MTNITFDASWTLLCEGEADEIFFKKILQHHAIPSANIIRLDGADNVDRKLLSLKGEFRTYPQKGFLVALDAKDDPTKTFSELKKKLEKNGFCTPSNTSTLSSKNDFPPTWVMLIPTQGKSGSLETPCLEVIKEKFPKQTECLHAFFACVDKKDPDFKTWNTETKAKAELSSLTAITHKEDPSKALSRVIQKTNFIDFGHGAFLPIIEELKAFCTACNIN